MRALSPDLSKVFRALRTIDRSIDGKKFLTACSTSLTAIRKFLSEKHPEWSADQIEYALNHSLGDVMTYKEGFPKLMRKRARS
jgi:hypothetical protein